jgi:RNA-splicing ligase RtcB
MIIVLVLKGRYNTATVYTDKIEPEAEAQIIELLNQDFIQGAKIAIMPDVHTGIGCTIGFTANLGDKVIPNIVGVDIGCGMLTIELGSRQIDLAELDDIINAHVPSGFKVHKSKTARFPALQDLYCYRELKNTKRLERSIGTLGGGNHFIEVNIDQAENKYLVIHTGSRNLGKQVAEYYQRLAVELCSGKEEYYKQRERLIEEYKMQGRRKELKSALQKLESQYQKAAPSYPKSLCYLEGEWRERYLHDMKICQDFATLNRRVIADIILQHLLEKTLDSFSHFTTIHNYVDFADNIIRKGAISAQKGEKVIIPINMRDGSIIAIGKGNPDWNYSAPHGAGRIMSRSEARKAFKLTEYQEAMEGIYSTSVAQTTIDEIPMAYKPIEEILKNIKDTADVVEVIKPIYNFKAK